MARSGLNCGEESCVRAQAPITYSEALEVLQLHKHLALVETSSHQRISKAKGTERTKKPNTYLPLPVDPDGTAKHQTNRRI